MSSFVWASPVHTAIVCARIDSFYKVRDALSTVHECIKDRLPAEIIEAIRYRVWDIEFRSAYETLWGPGYRCSANLCSEDDHWSPAEQEAMSERGEGHRIHMDHEPTMERHRRNMDIFLVAIFGDHKPFEAAKRVFSATYKLYVHFDIDKTFKRGFRTYGDLVEAKVSAFLTMEANERENGRRSSSGIDMRVFKPLGERERRIFVLAASALDLKGEREKVSYELDIRPLVTMRPKRMQLVDGKFEPAS